MFASLNKYSGYAPLVLRVAIGIIFLAHGLQKLGVFGGMNLTGVTGFFGDQGIPLPGLMAPLVALIEALGGLALILGFGTRIAAILLAIIMIVAIFAVKLTQGLIGGFELDLALLAGLVALILMGSGALALEKNVLSPKYT
jgi:putative oxidoreductase